MKLVFKKTFYDLELFHIFKIKNNNDNNEEYVKITSSTFIKKSTFESITNNYKEKNPDTKISIRRDIKWWVVSNEAVDSTYISSNTKTEIEDLGSIIDESQERKDEQTDFMKLKTIWNYGGYNPNSIPKPITNTITSTCNLQPQANTSWQFVPDEDEEDEATKAMKNFSNSAVNLGDIISKYFDSLDQPKKEE